MDQQLRTKEVTAEREWTVENLPVLTASVCLPEPEGERPSTGERRIRRYYRAQGKAFFRYCGKWLFPQAAEACRAALAVSAPLPRFRAELTGEITYNTDGLWSLYTQSRETGPEGKWMLRRQGDTWDLRTGYPVPIQRFFPPRSGWKRKLWKLAAEEIQRQERQGTARYREDWRRQLRRTFNPMNFYLTEEGLTFFYPMYAIAPAMEGIPTFTVPWGELRQW